MRRRRNLDAFRRHEAREPRPARAQFRAHRRGSSNQRLSRPRHRAQRGDGERPVAHRRPVGRDRHRRRAWHAAGFRVLGLHLRGTTRALHLAPQRTSVRAFPQPAGTAAARRPLELRPRTRHRARRGVRAHLPGHADAPAWCRRRQLLPRRQGEREGVHRRGRGSTDGVCVPSRGGDHERAHPPPTSAGPGPISRRWSRRRRSGSWCSTRRAAGQCRPTARRGGSGRTCKRPAIRRRSFSRWSPSGARTGARSR